MEVVKYKLLSKRQNDMGVSLTFQKTEEWIEENWKSKEAETFWEKLCSVFGIKPGYVAAELATRISEFDVFYPIRSGVHFDADLCYEDGSGIDYELVDKLKNLIKISNFKEKPIIEFVKKS